MSCTAEFDCWGWGRGRGISGARKDVRYGEEIVYSPCTAE